MWNLILYIIAIISGSILYYFYDENEDKTDNKQVNPCKQIQCSNVNEPRNSIASSIKSGISILGENFFLSLDHGLYSHEKFYSYEELLKSCKILGLKGSMNLIFGIDFTASNEWQGRKTFNQLCLHKLSGSKIYNPYQKVIWAIGQTLEVFLKKNKLIRSYGFGDSESKDKDIFQLKSNNEFCTGFNDLLNTYNEAAKKINYGGPTNYVPIIKKAIDICKLEKEFYIIFIITDGFVSEKNCNDLLDAISEASNFPLSIIVIGVGDGPMHYLQNLEHLWFEKFSNKNKLTSKPNYRFVDYNKIITKSKNFEKGLIINLFMDIPDHYKKFKHLGFISETFETDSSIPTVSFDLDDIPESILSSNDSCSDKSSECSSTDNKIQFKPSVDILQLKLKNLHQRFTNK